MISAETGKHIQSNIFDNVKNRAAWTVRRYNLIKVRFTTTCICTNLDMRT